MKHLNYHKLTSFNRKDIHLEDGLLSNKFSEDSYKLIFINGINEEPDTKLIHPNVPPIRQVNNGLVPFIAKITEESPLKRVILSAAKYFKNVNFNDVDTDLGDSSLLTVKCRYGIIQTFIPYSIIDVYGDTTGADIKIDLIYTPGTAVVGVENFIVNKSYVNYREAIELNNQTHNEFFDYFIKFIVYAAVMRRIIISEYSGQVF